MVAETVERLLTADELWALGPEWEHYELDEGRLVEVTPAGEIHGDVTMELAWRLKTHAQEHRLGKVYAAETGFRLNETTVRGPDIAFVRRERWKGPTERFFPGAPDLAVEVISPRDREHPGALLRKVSQYLAAGTALVWVIDPRKRNIAVHHPDGTVEIAGPDETLSGGDVLPGFSCRVAELFPKEPPLPAS